MLIHKEKKIMSNIYYTMLKKASFKAWKAIGYFKKSPIDLFSIGL